MGWKAEYFANQDYTGFLASRNDGPVLDVNSYQDGNKWYQDPLFSSGERQKNGVSVIWTSTAKAEYSEQHTLYFYCDNEGLVNIDGVQKAAVGNFGGTSFTMQLVAGQSYSFEVRFKNHPGNLGANPAILKLEWESASLSRRFVGALESFRHDFGKHVTALYRAHLESGNTSRALLWKVTRRDGRVFAYTPHDCDIIGDDITQDGVTPPECVGVVFKAKNGVAPTGLAHSPDLKADNMEVKAFFDDDEITEEEIEAGLFDDAEVWVAECNWRNLAMGIMRHAQGNMGKVSWGQGMFEAETRAASAKLEQSVIELTSLECRCKQLGDARCGVDLTGNTMDGYAITQTGTITTVNSSEPRRKFTVSGGTIPATPSGYFAHGRFRVTKVGRKNKDLWAKVRTNDGSTIELADPLPYVLEVGDTFEIIMGCDRTIGTCVAKFGNALRFRGEPNSPGVSLYNKKKS